jgi:CO/xanthine dehydrogenase FAD-binding subunit
LLALEAHAECFDSNGFTLKPIKEVIQDHVTLNGRTANAKIFITGFRIPLPPRGAWLQFMKQSARASLDFAIVNGALCYSPPNQDNPDAGLKLVIGAVGPEPIELTETAHFIREQLASPDSIKNAIMEKALAEVNAKCALIRDTGVSLKARKKAFGAVGRLIEVWHDDLMQRT